MDDPRRFLPLSPQQFQILLALTDRDRHGYGIILEIATRTGGVMRLGTGTLYTAVGRLLALGLIADTHRADDRRRFYRLAPIGKGVLKAETARLAAQLGQARAKGIQPARS